MGLIKSAKLKFDCPSAFLDCCLKNSSLILSFPFFTSTVSGAVLAAGQKPIEPLAVNHFSATPCQAMHLHR
jgi:hypothetical protein